MQPFPPNNLTRVVFGDRISSQGKLRLGCSAILFDNERSSILLTRRTDNGQWCLPGGMVDPGETVAEACERECYEETGLKVKVTKLTGVYSNPNRLTIYPDGNKVHVIVLNFEVTRLGGELGLSNETTAAQFFRVSDAIEMDLFHGHAEHIRDALALTDKAFIR
jgi:ADP-ribose pyrophosphatase YjhB (NUDIX family)